MSDETMTDIDKLAEQTCDLCAGECRGHILGKPEQWEPEVGSLAYTQDIVERLTDAECFSMKNRPLYVNSRMRDKLVARGLMIKGGGDWTPLGLSVRKLLEKQNG